MSDILLRYENLKLLKRGQHRKKWTEVSSPMPHWQVGFRTVKIMIKPVIS